MITLKQKKRLYNAFVLLLVAIAIGYVCSRFLHPGSAAYTDDAQVRQQLTPVNCRVQGFIKKVCFTEFQRVSRGDTLAVIEDAEYRLHVAQAEAQYATATAGKTATNTSVQMAGNNIQVSDASLQEVRIQMENAEKEMLRYKNLLSQKAVTQQQYDNVETAYQSLRARYQQMTSLKTASSLQRAEQTHRLSQSEAGIQLAEAAVNLAKLNLSYTVITAPCDGYTGRKEVLEGQLMQPGQPVVTIISDEDIWVTANYRETQLKHIHEGSPVTIKVDAIGDITYKGRVESLSKATEASYSPAHSNNSSGNFVKVEQRVPIRILFTADNKPEDIARLRSGLNVECSIDK